MRCYQIQTLDKRRLIKSLGSIKDQNIRDQIVQAMRFQLGFQSIKETP